MPFRPTARPPVALLTVFDDGKTEGETIRIRDSRFVIGRTEGDLKIPIDGRISSKHLEITHQVVGGLHRWVLTDMQSMHGLFVRVSKSVLADQSEFLIGGGRYQFEAAQETCAGKRNPTSPARRTPRKRKPGTTRIRPFDRRL